MLTKHYESNFIVTQNNNAVSILEMINNVTDEKILNELLEIYQKMCCNIRKELGITNAILLDIAIHKETNDKALGIHIFDLELLSEDSKVWYKPCYDKDRNKLYIGGD